MRTSYDVAIAGGGIVGASCAAECAAAGLSVFLAEPNVSAVARPPRAWDTSSSWTIRPPRSPSPITRAISGSLSRLSFPPDVEYLNAGTLWVAADAEEMAEVERKRIVYESIGVRAEILDSRALAEAEPNLRPGLAGALRVPDDAVVYPPCAARYLLDCARNRGAEIRVGVSARELSGGVMKLSDGTQVSAGIAINATGAWAPNSPPASKSANGKATW